MYRTIRNIGLSSIVAFALTGCGGGSSSSTSIKQSVQGIAELGRVAGAKVKIYELHNGKKTLKWTETTSGDANSPLNAMGIFDSHSVDMDINRLYIFEVTGGIDWDVNDDGIKDAPADAKPNTGVLRSATKGEWCYTCKGDAIRVTAATEMQARMLDEKISSGTLTEDDITESVDEILSTKDLDGDGKPDGDLDGDGKVDGRDMILFGPTTDEKALDKAFIPTMPALLESIHDAKDISADEKDSDGDGVLDKDEFDGMVFLINLILMMIMMEFQLQVKQMMVKM